MPTGDLTDVAKGVFRDAFPDLEWPKGWRVEWRFNNRDWGRCYFNEKLITISDRDGYAAELVETLCHEFIHMLNGPEFKHGKAFDTLTKEACYRYTYGYENKIQLREAI